MFFWVFESRNDPSRDPVILWLTGGPGASSIAFGALDELGPCVSRETDDETGGLVHNPYSWNSNATVIFVDQPLDVGYSYGKRRVRNLEEAINDLYAFLDRLFIAKPEWGERDFYVAGESYGGSWVPAIAARIQRMRTSPLARVAASVTARRPESSINLKGILVGNGLLNQAVQRRGFYEMGCTGSTTILSASVCTQIAEAGPRCELLEAACEASGFDRSVCDVSDKWCQANGWFPIRQTPWFPYDVRINCTATPEKCVSPPPGIVSWLDDPVVREGLGIDAGFGTAHPSSRTIFEDFTASGEVGYPSHPWVTELLDAGVRVLIYAGNKDWLCSSPGMLHFVDSLEWHGHAQFRAKTPQPVHAPASTNKGVTLGGGSTERTLWGHHKSHSLLSFMEIEEAGHLVPKDQPEVALAMLNYWIAGEL
ncbi:alpha/beta-hydrolase [Thozetella sp. PMI_491]|nr:alpha/beta-hydrolase [Thozetella sp. PMI_491]